MEEDFLNEEIRVAQLQLDRTRETLDALQSTVDDMEDATNIEQILSDYALAKTIMQTLISIDRNTVTVVDFRLPSYATTLNFSIIKPYFFYNCVALEQLTLYEGLRSIGKAAFYNCLSLKGLVIPEGLTTIGSSAFYNCNSMRNLTIPASVTSIGSNAFYNQSGSYYMTVNVAKTMATFKAMTNYPFGLKSKTIVVCSDGEYRIS